jgi:hypothetical protein
VEELALFCNPGSGGTSQALQLHKVIVLLDKQIALAKAMALPHILRPVGFSVPKGFMDSCYSSE